MKTPDVGKLFGATLLVVSLGLAGLAKRCDSMERDRDSPLPVIVETLEEHDSILKLQESLISNFDSRLSGLESKLETKSSETPVPPEPTTRKEQLKGFGKGLFKSVTQFGAFKLLLWLCK